MWITVGEGLQVNKNKKESELNPIEGGFNTKKSPVESPICSRSNGHQVRKNGSASMPCWAWQGRTGCCGAKGLTKTETNYNLTMN